MFSAIGKRLHLTPSTVIASLALVFAISGGAYAASKYVITSTKQIKPSVLKSLQGKSGAKGAPGEKGAPGAAGPAGPAGGAGAKGENGAAGANGTPGAAGPAGPAGAEGKEGEEGSPWTAGGTLPPGKTETGAWSVGFEAPGICTYESGCGLAPISFPIPLAAELSSSEVHYVTGAEQAGKTVPAACKVNGAEGSVKAPLAAPGNLCVYEGSLYFATFVTIDNLVEKSGASTAGAFLRFVVEEESHGFGSFAVTAP